MAGMLLQYGLTFPNKPSRYDAALRQLEQQRQSQRVGRMQAGDSSRAVEDLAGYNDRPVVLQNTGAYQGAIEETPAVDQQYEEMAQHAAHLMGVLAVSNESQARAIMGAASPKQVQAIANITMMGGRLYPQHAGELQKLKDASGRGTAALRRHQMSGGSFEDFRQDVHGGVGGFFKSFLNPATFIPMILAAGATIATGGAAAPVLAAAVAAGAAGIGKGVAEGVAEKQTGRAQDALDRKNASAQALIPLKSREARQFGVRI